MNAAVDMQKSHVQDWPSGIKIILKLCIGFALQHFLQANFAQKPQPTSKAPFLCANLRQPSSRSTALNL